MKVLLDALRLLEYAQNSETSGISYEDIVSTLAGALAYSFSIENP